MKAARFGAGLGLVIVIISGCGQATGPTGPAPDAPTPGMPAPSPPTAEPLTISGTVERGVEPNCFVLRTDGPTYLLLGDDPDIERDGQRVVVRGEPQRGIATTCMQGIPLRVLDAWPQ